MQGIRLSNQSQAPGVVGYGSHGNLVSKIVSKVTRNIMIKDTLSNPDSRFNNILNIKDLVQFYDVIVENLDNKKLTAHSTFVLASKDPISFKSAIEVIFKKTDSDIEKFIEWSDEETNSFCIDISEAVSEGFRPLSTVDSLERAVYDISAYIKRN